VQQALGELWPLTRELFDEDDAERALVAAGIAPALAEVEQDWSGCLDGLLRESTLERPPDTPYRWFGRRGVHSEHLGHILADLQYLQRAHPGAEW
jgi:ring-1,2-phenylacetyl-CoA epoxidase subunit PaaC